MPKRYITASSLFNELKNIKWEGSKGSIYFSIVNTKVKITHTDIIGNVLQDWVKNYFIINNIYYREPSRYK
jgi:ngoBV restriction endonuclease